MYWGPGQDRSWYENKAQYSGATSAHSVMGSSLGWRLLVLNIVAETAQGLSFIHPLDKGCMQGPGVMEVSRSSLLHKASLRMGRRSVHGQKKKKKKTTVSQIYIMSGRETCWAKEWHRTGSWGLVATGRVGREHLTEKLASERRPETV